MHMPMASSLRTRIRTWLEARDAAKANAQKDAQAKAASAREPERQEAERSKQPPGDDGGNGPGAT
jgi:hypothetical protein